MMRILINTTRPTGVEGAGGPGCGAHGRRRGLAGLRGTVPKGLVGLAAAPAGGGGAWPGFEIDHSEPQARVWRSRGRAAAHGRTKQPGPTAGPSGTQNTRGTPSSPARQRIQKRPPETGWAYLSRLWESNPRPIHYE